MPNVSDGQANFLGGMRDSVSPELVGENEYAFGENIELRNGRPETRRGSWRVLEDLGTTFTQGAGIFLDIPTRREYVMVAQNEQIFRIDQEQRRTPMATPDALTLNEIRFLQALDRLYIFRGEGLRPFRWSGDTADSIILVPDAITESSMPGSTRVLFAYNRFWIITGTDTLNISDLLSEEFNLTTNSFQVSQGDGQRLIALQPFGAGKLIAFKERSIAIISNANNFTTAVDAANGLTLEFIDDEVGCDSQDSIVNIGKDIFFKSKRGIYSLQQTSEQNAQLIDVPLSEPITDLFERVEQQNAASSQGILFDNYYLIGIPIDGAEVPNAILAFDLELKRWVGIWRIVDSASLDDDGFWRHARLLVKNLPRPKLMSVGRRGGLAELLRGRHEDLVPSDVAMDFRFANSPKITFDSATITALSGQNAGSVELDIQFDSNTPTASFVILFQGSTQEIFIQNTPTSSGVTPPFDTVIRRFKIANDRTAPTWEFITATEVLPDTRLKIRLSHDGTEPSFFIDGSSEQILFTVSTDKTVWLDDITLGSITIGEPTASDDSFDGRLVNVRFENSTGGIVANFPLNEGTGTALTGYEVVAGKSVGNFGGTFASSPTYDPWIVPPAASAILTQLTTRGYAFGQIQVYKKIIRGILEMVHMDPNISVQVINNEPFDDETILTGLTFDETKYDVHNIPDWVASNVNDDFETPFRQRYSPVNMGVAGIFIGLGGITLDQDRDRSQFIRSEAVAKWFQLDVQSSRDMIGVVATAIDGQTRNLSALRDF